MDLADGPELLVRCAGGAAVSGATRYPLSWPAGWRRTAAGDRRSAAFGRRGGSYGFRQALTIADALDRVSGELRRLGVADWLLSSNLRMRQDGLPYSQQSEPADPGVAIYFKLGGKDRTLACDQWRRAADNIAAIAAHIECLRGIDRYGVGTIDQAFAGYAALPPSAEDWRTVFGLVGTPMRAAVEARYLELAKQHHPDRGGDPAMMAKLNAAREAARRELAS